MSAISWSRLLARTCGLVCLGALFATQEAYPQRQSRFRSGSEVRSHSARPAKPTKPSKPAPHAAATPSAKEHNLVKEDGRTVVYRKRNVVDFDGALIEGEIRNPNEFYFVHRPEEKFGSLVGKRKNFHKEMLRDAVMIR